MADQEEIFTTSFQAGRKRIYVDVKENHAGTYLKIKERGDSQSNSILIPSGSIVELRNALDEAVQALESLDASKGGGAGGASAASPANQCVCHVGNLSRAVWKSNFGRPTPSTRRRPRTRPLDFWP